MARKLTIDKSGDTFIVDDPNAPGSPPIGSGRTMMEAIGSWFHNNQDRLGFEFEVLPNAQPAEKARRDRELSKR